MMELFKELKSPSLPLRRREGALCRDKKNNAGFTLIELLVVMVMISIIASLAVLSISMNKNKQIETLTQQLTNTLNLAQQEALLRSTTLGLVVTKHAFQFYQLDSKENTWVGLSDSLLGLKRIPKELQLTLKIQSKIASGTPPKLIIFGSGELTPFTLYIGREGSSPLYKIMGEPSGHITSEMIHAN